LNYCITVSDECKRTLRVSGLPEKANDDVIYPVFESKRIDGGKVEIIHPLSDASVLITFYDEDGEPLVMIVTRLITSVKETFFHMAFFCLSICLFCFSFCR